MFFDKQTKALICGLSWVFIFIPLSFTHSLADPLLQYQDRIDRYEGIKPKPVGSWDTELISVSVSSGESITNLPERFKIRFFLPQLEEVYVTVRELDYRHYYWLDKIKPSKPWTKGFNNEFSWPTDTVIKHLQGLRIENIGVVVRLGTEKLSEKERVAPAILYAAEIPSRVSGYRFTFRTGNDARMTVKFYRNGAPEAIDTQHYPLQPGGRPFTIEWNSAVALPGEYKLVIEGFFLDNNNWFAHTVQFYHQPNIK